MPEPGNCCKSETAKPHSIDPEPSKSSELSPIQSPDGDHDVDHGRSTGRGCPKVESCPNATEITREGETEKGDGDMRALENARSMPAGPLGPFPSQSGENVPLDYWTPLGNLTRTRPVVENFSLSRFSPSEWREHNDKISRMCREGIEISAIAGFNARCSLSKAYAEADRNQEDNNERLSVRAGLIHRWKNELEKIVKDIIEEIDLVGEARRRTMRAESVLKLVENIGKDIMRVRCFHVDNDLVRDQVSEEIIRELSLCEEIRDVYIRLLDQMKMQIDELKSAKQRLEFDWSNKSEAYEIDAGARGLNSESDIILWKPGSVRLPPDQSSPSSWEYSTKQIITEGITARERSTMLRANADTIIEKAVHDLRDQADRTDLALTDQIELQEQALRRLEVELIKDLQQLADTETLVEGMRDATRKLDGTMKCAQTRLADRLSRPAAENCRDIPQFGLIEEVKSLSENVTAALGQMKRTDDSTAALIETRRILEKELMIKRKSLYIDRERCKLLRTFYPSVKALSAN